ncbi:MAG: GNAT family N-acetyltransferase [Blastocatellia bacterium]|nr:GNAT family N-acetyltransferase [Blastocatellia bacterium]
MFDQFSNRARRIIFFSLHAAQHFRTTAIEPEHILWGLLQEAPELFHQLSGGSKQTAQHIRESLFKSCSQPAVPASPHGLPLSPQSQEVVRTSQHLLEKTGLVLVEPEHVLASLLLVVRPKEGFLGFQAPPPPLIHVLESHGINLEQAQAHFFSLKPPGPHQWMTLEPETITLREAYPHELDWINQCYGVVDFVPSDFSREFIAVAEVSGVRAGLGRLVEADENTVELGGMLVFEPFRRLGLAQRLIHFLLGQAANREVYCIPFMYLCDLYRKAGFESCHELEGVPLVVREKLEWCQNHYPQKVSLLTYRGGKRPRIED